MVRVVQRSWCIALALLLLAAPVFARGSAVDGTMLWGMNLGPSFATGDIGDVADLGVGFETVFGVHIIEGFGVRIDGGYSVYEGSDSDFDYTTTAGYLTVDAYYDFSRNQGFVHPYILGGFGFISTELEADVVLYDPYWGWFEYTYSDSVTNLCLTAGGGAWFGPFGRNFILRTEVVYRNAVGGLALDYFDEYEGTDDATAGYVTAGIGIAWQF